MIALKWLQSNMGDPEAPHQLVNYDGKVLTELTESCSWSNEQDNALKDFIRSANNCIERIDWNEIGHRLGKSAQECFGRYHNVLAETVNSSDWEQAEKEQLQELVSRYGPYNWIVLSEQLGTNRTPIECLRFYQRHLNQDHIQRCEWTKEEDLLLREAVTKFGLGNWENISDSIPHRSAAQCKNRWSKSVECREDIVAGRWSEIDERKLYLLAISLNIPTLAQSKYPMEVIDALYTRQEIIIISEEASIYDYQASMKLKWSQISELLPGKSEYQCREKWSNNLDPTILTSDFSEDDDAALTLLVQQFGEGHWAKIAKYLPGRTDAAVRRRWLHLKKDTIGK